MYLENSFTKRIVRRIVFSRSPKNSFFGLNILLIFLTILNGCKGEVDKASLISVAQSTISVAKPEIKAGETTLVTLVTKDQTGNPIYADNLDVQFGFYSTLASSTGTFDTVVDHQNGTYTTTLTGKSIGKGTRIIARINNNLINSNLDSEFSVSAGPVAIEQCTFSPLAVSKLVAGQSIPVTFQVRDKGGNQLVTTGLSISFVNLGTGTSGGSFSQVIDNGNGTYSTTFTAKAAGTPTTFAGQLDGKSGTSVPFTIQVVPGNADSSVSTISTSNSVVPADGITSENIIFTLTDSGGNPISGKSVFISSSRGTGYETITPSIGTTNSSGQVIFSITSLIPGSATFSGFDSTDSLTLSGSVTLNFYRTETSANLSSLVTSPKRPPADGTTAGLVTITLRDTVGNLSPGKLVTLTSSRGGIDTISPASLFTDSRGVAIFSVKSSTIGIATFTAVSPSDSITLTQKDSFTFIPSNVTAAQSTVSASPATVVSNGVDISYVTVTLKDISSNAVEGKTVTLASSRGLTDTISPASIQTDLNGQAVFTVKSNVSGTSTLTATDISDSIIVTQTGTVNFISGNVVNAQSTVSTSSSNVVADGTTTATVTVTLKDQFTNPVPGKTVALSSSRGVTDTITPPTAVTNSLGQAIFTITSTTSGLATITATDSTDSLTLTQTTAITFRPGAGHATQSTLSANPVSVITNGVSTSSISVTIKDQYSNVVPNKTVTLASDRGGIDVISPFSAVTNASGVATFVVVSNKAGVATFTATDTTDSVVVTQTAAVTYTPGNVTTAQSTVTSDLTSLVANDIAVSTITVTLKDQYSNTVPGKTVEVTSSRGVTDTISPASATTDTNGQAVFTVKSTLVGSSVFSVADTTDSINLPQTVTVNFIPGPASAVQSTVTPSTNSVTADGSTAIIVTVILLDQYSNAVPNKSVTLTSSRGALDTVFASLPTSDANGQAQFTVTSTKAGTSTFTIRDTTDSVDLATTPVVTYTPGISTAAQSTLTASPASVVADNATDSTITVTLKDQFSNIIPGKTVTLSSNRGADVIAPASGVTDANGQTTFTVHTTLVGSPVLTATNTTDSVAIPQASSIVTFIAATAFAANSKVSANLYSVPANGTTLSTVTVTLYDQYMNLVPGKTVSIASSRGATDTISPASAVTNASGQATFTVKSSTQGNATITATNSTDAFNVTQTISLRFSLSSTQISGFMTHSCAVMSNQTVQCWGQNAYGQLGDGTTTSQSTPVTVSGISTATAVAVGGNHTCALLSNSTVKCWGYNSNGQIGDATTTTRTTPVSVSGISTATGITAGYAHSCAVLSNATVQCWGANNISQLGDGTTIDRTSPVAVLGMTTATAVAAEYQATCARLSNSTIKCWGFNGTGGLGDGTTTNRSSPATVSGITTANTIGAGHYHACTILSTGAARCWGDNTYGQLGDNSVTQRNAPVAVSGITASATRINGIGQFNTCAVVSGQVKCWGDNTYGQIGDNTVTRRLVPVNVSGLANGSSVSGGQYHTCSLLTDGSIKCWGTNPNGNLGNGITGGISTPITVSGVTSPSSIAIGLGHACALAAGGTVQCWGANNYGQLGDGTTTDRLSPVSVSGLTNATAIAAGAYHTCAILNTQTIQCWGYNVNGAIGDGTTTNRSVPTNTSTITNATAIAAGAYSTCALLADQTVKCWGNNSFGTVGDGTTTQRTTPTTVAAISTGVSITLSNYHACARLADNTAQCWGYNTSGQAGDGTTTNKTLPVSVSGLTTVSNISAGGFHTCAALSDNTVKCWGSNASGSIGDNTLTNRLTPTAVSGISTASAIASGYQANCALLSDQTVKCWGDNLYSQLGDGTNATQRLTPVSATGISSATSIYSGYGYQRCAVLSNGNVICWGNNSFGQIGNGSATNIYVPGGALLQ